MWRISWRADLAVFMACAGTRLAALWWFPPPRRNYFWEYSDGILQHSTLGADGRASAYLEPVYPAFLAVVRWLAGDRDAVIMLIQIAVSAGGGVALFRLAARQGRSAKAGFIAAGLYGVYPYYVRQSVAYECLTLLTTLLIISTSRFTRIGRTRDALACGLWLGLTILTRTSLAPLVALFALVLAAERRWTQAVALTLATVTVTAPWMLRNYRVDGATIPTRMGENLFVSTSRFSGAVLPGYDVDLLVPEAQAIVARESGRPAETMGDFDAKSDRILLREALRYARANPWETLRLKLTNFLYVFVPRLVPFYGKSDTTSVVFRDATVRVEGAVARPAAFDALHSIGYGSILVLAAIGLFKRRHDLREDQPLLAVVATVVAVNTVFFTTTRLAAPMVFVLMVYAACALTTAEYPGVRPARRVRTASLP